MPSDSTKPSSSTAVNFFDKTPGEAPTLGIPFSGKMQAGDSITGAGTISFTSVTALDATQPLSFQNWQDTGLASTDLTAAGQAIIASMAGAVPPGPGIAARISGGTEGLAYMWHISGVTTAKGDVLENEALIFIKY